MGSQAKLGEFHWFQLPDDDARTLVQHRRADATQHRTAAIREHPASRQHRKGEASCETHVLKHINCQVMSPLDLEYISRLTLLDLTIEARLDRHPRLPELGPWVAWQRQKQVYLHRTMPY